MAVLVQAERLPQPGHGLVAAEQLPGAQDRQHQVEFGFAGGRLAEDVQSVADLDVLDLAQPAVDVQQHVVEGVLVGTVVEAEVVVHLGRPHQGPDLLADGGQLAGIERGNGGVLVEQLFESCDVAVGFGAGHRRDEVVDQGGVGAPFGLRALARVVDQERVDQRQVAQCRVGAAGRRHAQRLAGQPLEVAVLAEMHDGIGLETCCEPAIRGQVVMTRRQVGVVVDGHRVLAEAARRLHHQHHVAGPQGGDHDFTVGVVRAVDEQLARRWAPMSLDRIGEFGGQCGEPFAVVLGGQPNWIADELPVGEPGGVLATALDERVHQCVAVARVHAGNVGRVPQVETAFTHGPQQSDGAGRRVQTDRVADPGMLGRVGREHDGHPLGRGRDCPQPGMFDGQAGDALAAFRVGDVADQALVVNLLERERDCDDAAVEFRDCHLGGHVERAHPVVVVMPLRPRTGQAQSLQDRDVQGGQMFHVPGVVGSAGRHRRRCRSPGGQHGGHQGVGLLQLRDQLGFGGAQRRAEHRKRTSALVLDGPAQRLDVRGVAGELLGAVIEHRDGRAVVVGGRRPVQDAPARRAGRRGETEPRHQHGVAEEGVQLAEVVHAALRQIDMCLHRHARGNGGVAHQLRVG